MVEKGLRNYMVIFTVIALFVISMIMFAYHFGAEYGADETILDDPNANIIYQNVNDTLKPMNERAYSSQNASKSIDKGILGSVSSLLMGFITSTGKGIMSGTQSIFNAILSPLLKMLGLPREISSIIGVILTTILLFTITLLVWRLYRTGK